MASFIVKDSGLNIFVKEIPVTSSTVSNNFVVSGNKFGLAGTNAQANRAGTAYYTTVDTAALVRFTAVAIAFTDGQSVYWTGTAISGTASGNLLIGYADRPKGAASGDLHVQLVPTAV